MQCIPLSTVMVMVWACILLSGAAGLQAQLNRGVIEGIVTDPQGAIVPGVEGPLLPNMRSPGFWNLDASLEKEFHLTEAKYFDFRWEVLNALNHQNLGSPNTSFWLPPLPDGTADLFHQAGCQFGRITDIATDPRSMEFALKFYW